MKIADLPFRERPALELLAPDVERDAPDRDYAGYGWARVGEVWLDELRVTDALVLAIHSADDAEVLADDVELEFELPDVPPVSVLASLFLARWLPRLPATSAIVLAMCNPHHARLPWPEQARAPLYLPLGDVEAWLDRDDQGDRIRLVAAGSWVRLTA